MLPLESILAIVACLLVGRELSKWLLSMRSKASGSKRAAQELAIQLREFGLKLFPRMLEDFVLGDTDDMLGRIRDLSTIAKSGDDAILRELNGTFERVLDVKLRSAEGRAVVAAKLAEAEKIATIVGPVVAAV
jgi:hypothetical protein